MYKNELFNGSKKQPFTKEELSNYIDIQINLLKKVNPILSNTYLIKIDCDKLNSWFNYLGSIDCFIEDSYNLLSSPKMFIWPKCINGKIQVYVLMHTENEKHNKRFLEQFVLNYLWPHAESKIKVQEIKNISVVLNMLLLFKNSINKSKSNTTNYIKDKDLIFNAFDFEETIEEAKQRLQKQLNKIYKFEKRFIGEK